MGGRRCVIVIEIDRGRGRIVEIIRIRAADVVTEPVASERALNSRNGHSLRTARASVARS
jgi:hypothetical protein